MRIQMKEKGVFFLECSVREMTVLNNALNEICNGIEVRDFDARVGASINFALGMLGEVDRAMTKAGY